MSYSFKELLKMFFAGKPNPYTSSNLAPKTRTAQVIHFPDGVVTLTDKRITSPIPDIFLWTEPMQELFLLIVKDWRNWVDATGDGIWTHKITKDKMKLMERKLQYVGNRALTYNLYVTNLSMSEGQASNVALLAEVWKEVHYRDKLRRISRIKPIRDERLAKEIRQKEAQQIRNYLQENGL